MRFILKLLIFLGILLFGIAILSAYWTFYSPLPEYDAEIHLDELQQEVKVHWDPYAVPYIYAESEDDLYYSIGYIHAQDRLWQMTLSQIAAEGRFAEFLGKDLVEYDIHQRTLGFWETAKRIEAEAPDSLLHILERYSAGVNAFIDQNRDNLPAEFTLLGVKPIEWTPTHTIALSRLMAWDQNIHWWSELTYAYLAEELDPYQFQQLIPVYNDRYPTTLSDSESSSVASATMPLLETELDLRSALQKKGTQFGSNAWAVNGSKTVSGRPILAGDPHMGLSIPGFWYEVSYHTPNHQISGATIPGSPFVVLGQNEYIAWSMTNIMADDTDFFSEQINSNNPDEYILDSVSDSVVVYEEFNERREIIQVKDSDDELHVVRSTKHGPIISDIHPDSSLGDKLVSFSWMGHQVSQEVWALYKMNHAKTMNEFRNAVEGFDTPGMNFIYADSDDNIAIFTGANLPIRDYNPLMFRHGWDPSYDWQSTIPFDDLPHVVNPEQGFVAHANNKMHTDSYPYYISTFWEPPSRIMRINQYLEMSDSLQTETMQAMQNDVYSEHAREITEMILPILRSGENSNELQTALSYLENWNFEYTESSTAATIFDLFFINLTRNVLLDEIGSDLYEKLTRLEHLPVMIISEMLQSNSAFFDNQNTLQTETRDQIVRDSMAETLQQLNEEFGSQPFEWRWENVLKLTLQPPLLSEASQSPEAPAVFKMIVNNLFSKGPFTVRGNTMSINKGQYNWEFPFEMYLGPSIRRIVDFSTPGKSQTILPTGQSGNPLSTYYGDQTNLWLDGRYRFIYQDSTFFQETSFETMTLSPN
ncbi:penicillin acylase family protein [Rhodohalobacter sp. 614A]|uniref:penicillin acylase family protein n=1 Tax=Rhodohalobacter sp. 614A TaxID=2908649 RepID=UPI001F3AEE9C|nr:penicillin acylase family protein [Rhodohalobacter sp. 614A]